MKNLLLTLILITGCNELVFSQNASSTLKRQADSLFQLNQFPQAIPVYQEVSQVFLEQEDWPQYLTTLNQLSKAHWKLFDLETATILTDSVIHMIDEHDSKDEDRFQLMRATALYNKGVISVYLSKLTEAVQWMGASLEIREKLLDSKHADLHDVYNGMGAVYLSLQEMDLALSYFDKTIEAAPNSPNPARMNRALIYRVRGEYHRALDELLTQLQIYSATLGEGHPSLLQIYANMAPNYLLTREYEKALDAASKSLEGKKKLYGPQFAELHHDYTNLGLIYDSKSDSKMALYYLNQALELLLSLNIDGRHDPDLAHTYSNIANSYTLVKQYDSALIFSMKAEEIYTRINEPINRSINYQIIGDTYRERREFVRAREFYDKTLNTCLAYLGSNHNQTAAIYDKIADSYAMEEDYDKTMFYMDKALAASVVGDLEGETGYSIENVPTPSILVVFLNKKAIFHVRQYEKSDSLQYLNDALEVIESALAFAKEYRYYYQRYEDKHSYGKEIQDIYVSALEISYLLYQETRDETYLDKAFSFMEQSKSQVLENHLLDREAKKYSGIEKEVLLAEGKLNSDWTYYQSELLKLKSQKEGYDTARFDRYRDKLVVINQRKDSINSYLEQNHEEYFHLKYRDITTSIEKLQKTLAPKQAFLNYMNADSTLHVLVLTKDKRQWIRIANDSTLLQVRDEFKRALEFPGEQDFKSLVGGFRQSANQLYDYLLDPILSNMDVNIDRLIISPMDDYSSLPWELFVKPGEANTIDFPSMNYLLKDYAVCYTNSASLFQYGLNKQKNSGKTLLAFAPSYEGAAPEQYALRNSFRGNFYDLEWNDQEVERIGQHFESDIRIGEQATEDYFKEQASQHRILHLAMHGYVDHEEPLQSKLLFFKDSTATLTDSLIDDGILYAYELFDMDLGAELAVLSACKTGLGKTRVGEGVMSLARAFLYAGCPSVVMSHWSVDDQATSILIANFYEHLASGTSKDQALRNAKLTYLNEANGPYAHPFYWGAFVLNGDPDPLKSDRRLIWLFVVAGMAVLMLFFFIKTRRS